ncbi:hypothetical protein GIR22_24515 [Pseudomonas sp. CCM 7891]|uniref:Uncharacterized protein n=1 Tax=Pseudomonas karstica TaxID=1055468 RepID=A0A7X2RY24_9PSED|nr:hypothetical protein [Pseudomonas karstica]MTD22299.1 hypothetical protein [Pseudomonas karstica]
MNFQLTAFPTVVLPDLRTRGSALRAKLSREPVGFSPTRATFVSPSLRVSPAPVAHWRICPTTGQRLQQCDHADPQDPQSRNASSLFAGWKR